MVIQINEETNLNRRVKDALKKLNNISKSTKPVNNKGTAFEALSVPSTTKMKIYFFIKRFECDYQPKD